MELNDIAIFLDKEKIKVRNTIVKSYFLKKEIQPGITFKRTDNRLYCHRTGGT